MRLASRVASRVARAERDLKPYIDRVQELADRLMSMFHEEANILDRQRADPAHVLTWQEQDVMRRAAEVHRLISTAEARMAEARAAKARTAEATATRSNRSKTRGKP